GHEEVVEVHLERGGVVPNAVDTEYGQTPPSSAVRHGDVAVVSLLLEREDLNPNSADSVYGRTPLMWAAEAGNGKVAEMLLARRNLNLHTPDFSGETVLPLATSKGYTAVVMLLSEHDHSLTISSDTKEAPEHLSPELGHGETVKILFARDNVNTDTAETRRWTPLSWAAWHGNPGVLKIILRRTDVNPNTADNGYGLTLLSLAVWPRHLAVVRLLLQYEELKPNPAETDGDRKPLMWATDEGYDNVVEMLLAHHDL
ncbi:ankyrin, partial [Choiromyces venosus 120613-1]